jgi:gas vesicle protein
MSRTKLALTVAGVAVAAGAAGCALGLLCAPASGKKLRRRLAWRTQEEWRSAALARGRLFERAFDRARKELEDRGKRFAETIAARVS